MKIDISKVNEVIIRDINGNITDRFKIEMAQLITTNNKERILTITKQDK